MFLNVVMECVHVFRPAFIRGKLSSVILSPCTCRYKLLNQPHQLALAVCGGFRHTHTHTLAPLLGSLIDRVECKNTNFLITAGNVIWKNRFRFEQQLEREQRDDVVGS